ncbi:hypothetical protein BH10PSE1_BH10PSE1_01410 [soil metagenome]
MIWLRHEVWEHHDGLSYRLASAAETDRVASIHAEGVIKHVFYAPSPAAAAAQYYALRHLGPYVPGPDVSQEGFTAAQLESQQAEFPDDAILSGQGVPHSEPEAHASSSEPEPTHPVADDHEDGHGEVTHADHPVEQESPAVVAHEPEPAVVTDAASHEPTPPHDPKDLWPVAEEEIVAPRWASRPRRRSNPFLAFLRVVLLLIILAAVAVGISIVTGTVDGPTLLAQVRDLSIVKSVLPSA